MKLFGLNRKPEVRGEVATPQTQGEQTDFAGRAQAMNARAATATTTEDAINVMQEAAGITNDLMKAVSAMAAPNPTEPTDETTDEPTDETIGDDATAPDTAAAPPASDAEAPADATPEDATSATEDDPDNAPKLAKSVEELLAEANRVAQDNGAELQVDASSLIGALLKSVAASQEQTETTNNYLEQLGALLSKSLEGLSAIAENQQALHETQVALNERLDRFENDQREGAIAADNQPEQLAKSVEAMLQPIIGYVNSQRQAPQGTPAGRAPLAPNSVVGVSLADAAPLIEPEVESFNGFTRAELKKSIEVHIRSDRAKETGINSQHFLAIGRTPLSELDPLIYEIAARELKRPLPGN